MLAVTFEQKVWRTVTVEGIQPAEFHRLSEDDRERLQEAAQGALLEEKPGFEMVLSDGRTVTGTLREEQPHGWDDGVWEDVDPLRL